MRKFLAIFLGKIILYLSQILKLGGGTTAPGKIALKIFPQFLNEISKNFQKGVILITATNGKTTITKILVQILKEAGFQPIYNAGGSNLPRGIASAIIKKYPLFKKLQADFGVFEVDEAYLGEIIKTMKPSLVILANLFRDQLDRYGEIDIVAQKWQKALSLLPSSSFVLANADDPNIVFVAQSHKNVKFFGLEKSPYLKKQLEHIADALYCKNCRQPLLYKQIFFSHLGKYLCPSCHFQNPSLDFALTDPLLKKEKIEGKIKSQNALFSFSVTLEGLYNLYNLLSAISAALFLKINSSVIQKALKKFSAAFGRQEKIRFKEREIKIVLVKNPTGFNQALEILKSQKPSATLFILNDKIADGKDVSWIWDVDFESLPPLPQIFFSGRRAFDMALRLKYADQKIKNENIIPDIKKAFTVALKNTPQNQTLFIFPTYTALLELRTHLQNIIPSLKKFWEE